MFKLMFREIQKNVQMKPAKKQNKIIIIIKKNEYKKMKQKKKTKERKNTNVKKKKLIKMKVVHSYAPTLA